MPLPRKPVLHESVADVLVELGVKNKNSMRAVNAPNNVDFLTERAKTASKVIAEETEEDETDGVPDETTTASNKPAGTEVKNTPVKTKVKLDDKKTDETVKGKPVVEKKELPDFIKKKMEEKSGKKDEEKEGSKDEEKSETKDEEKEEEVDESEKFYSGLKQPVTFVLWENKAGEPTVEVHGITEDELAPFGGKAPAMPAKWAAKAKSEGKIGQGSVGALVLYKTEGMDKQTAEILAGGALRAIGWKPPMKGTGTKITQGGQSK